MPSEDWLQDVPVVSKQPGDKSESARLWSSSGRPSSQLQVTRREGGVCWRGPTPGATETGGKDMGMGVRGHG